MGNSGCRLSNVGNPVFLDECEDIEYSEGGVSG